MYNYNKMTTVNIVINQVSIEQATKLLQDGLIMDSKVEPTLQQLVDNGNTILTLIGTDGSFHHLLSQYNPITNEILPPITDIEKLPPPIVDPGPRSPTRPDCANIAQLKYEEQKYMRYRIFRPYIGLRLVKVVTTGDQPATHINYVVTKPELRPDGSITGAYVTQVFPDGTLANYPEEPILIIKAPYKHPYWGFLQGGSPIIPGIADDNGNIICEGENTGHYDRPRGRKQK